jgi:hypothetical protein
MERPDTCAARQCGEVFSKTFAIFQTFGAVVSTEMKHTQKIKRWI